MSGAVFVLWLLAANTALAAVLLSWGLFLRRDKCATLALLAFLVFVCPLVGPVFLGAGYLLGLLRRRQDLDMAEISFSKEREELLVPPNEEVERNIIPIRDAMAVSTATDTRRLINDILKTQGSRVRQGMAWAIDNADTEVSHYAAVAVIDALSDFRKKIQVMMAGIRRWPDNVDEVLEVLSYIQNILDMNVMNRTERASTIYLQQEAAGLLFEHNPWYLQENHYLWLVDHLIWAEDWAAAQLWVDRAISFVPDRLSTYKARLHLAYRQSDQAAFFTCLEDIKASSVTADSEVVEALRLFTRPGEAGSV